MATLRAYVRVFVVRGINMRRRWNRNGPSPISRGEIYWPGFLCEPASLAILAGLRRYSIHSRGECIWASIIYGCVCVCVEMARGPLLRIPAAKITAALNFNGGDDKYRELIAVFKLE